MKNTDMLKTIKEKAQKWLEGNYDEETKKQVKHLLEHDENELIESFYKDLEFGTGGLRGIMGVGTNRLNIYTVGMATQGLCNYVKHSFASEKQLKMAIAHDCRNNSRLYAETTAQICSANNIKVYLFESLRPTPELSFAIRYFGCQSGVVITASHNPKEYNGFKAYWDDGGQLIEPHDVNVVNEARKITDISDVKFTGNDELIEIIGEEFDEIYLQKIKELSLSPETIAKNSDMKIVFTPIHGTGVKLVPDVLKKFGFENIYNIPEQDKTDGNFPTVVSPNPENREALEMAVEKAKQVDAELIMATDPDADRVGIAVKDNSGQYILLNGNQTASVLLYYLITKWAENNKLTGKEYIVKTIVTSELLNDIADKYNVEHYDVLTGFKYIADIMKSNEGKKTFIGGGEESYGYLAGEFVRDKDAVMSCALIAEAAAWARENQMTLFDMLLNIYSEFGFYKEALENVVKKGKSGAEEISRMMDEFRTNPPSLINNSKVEIVKDYLTSTETNMLTNVQIPIKLPKSNVLQFFLNDGSKISIRPSGTEPKIKFYIGVKGHLLNKSDYEKTDNELNERIKNIMASLGLGN
jgi:phosphoglucomutase